MGKTLPLLVASLFLCACASELVLQRGDALAVIPMEVSDSGHIVVEAVLDGRGPFEFAMDTGASISVVFESTLARAGIEPRGGETVRVIGMTGSGSFPVAVAGSIVVGKEVWANPRVAVLPDSGPEEAGVDGLLGTDFLVRYAVWYSQNDGVLRLYPKDKVEKRTYANWNSLALHELPVGDGDVTLYGFDLFIDARQIPAIFDLGASVNLMNLRAGKLLKASHRSRLEASDIWGVVGTGSGLSEIKAVRLQTSGRFWRNQDFVVGDFPVFEALGIDDRPAALVGTDLFRHRDFIIDFANQRLLVER